MIARVAAHVEVMSDRVERQDSVAGADLVSGQALPFDRGDGDVAVVGAPADDQAAIVVDLREAVRSEAARVPRRDRQPAPVSTTISRPSTCV
jgi:hypothetical protein